ncbi:MAG: hypothetical protein ACYSP9_04530 [Planctomycetota bacterium]|jgi:hypothetical protein
MEWKAVFTGEKCQSVMWEKVSGETVCKPLRCDINLPVAVQVNGDFYKADLEGSCDGVDFDPIVTFSMQGTKKVDFAPLYIRPSVREGEATITVVLRR